MLRFLMTEHGMNVSSLGKVLGNKTAASLALSGKKARIEQVSYSEIGSLFQSRCRVVYLSAKWVSTNAIEFFAAKDNEGRAAPAVRKAI